MSVFEISVFSLLFFTPAPLVYFQRALDGVAGVLSASVQESVALIQAEKLATSPFELSCRAADVAVLAVE